MLKKFRKKKNKKINIEILKLDFDAWFKFLIIINSLFLVYFIHATELGISELNTETIGRFMGYIVIGIFDVWLMIQLIKIYAQLREELLKKKK